MDKPHGNSKASKIRAYASEHPDESAENIAKAVGGVSSHYVYTVLYNERVKQRKEKAKPKRKYVRKTKSDWQLAAITTSNTPMPVQMIEPPADPVNHPAHYKVGGIETIDFIEAKQLNYNLGNAIKYITRADHKGNRRQDLEKAVWYLNRELSHA